MGTMAKFLKHESLSAVKKDKQVGNKAMFGTNKLCMKGIYLPTFQRSIILRANEDYKKCTQLFTVRQPLEGKTCFITCVFICIIYSFFSIISLDKTLRYCGGMLSPSSNSAMLLQRFLLIFTLPDASSQFILQSDISGDNASHGRSGI